MKKNQYSLFTTIGMIVGIVIGSGIFFKSDSILVATNGSIFLGVLIFILAAIGIIFGGLSIAELASRNDKAGGIISYAEDYCGDYTACAFGWFYSFLYFPALIAVVAYVSVVYLCQLFNLNISFGLQIIFSFIILVLFYVINILSVKLGGYFQNASTIIKLIPLIFIAILGIILGDTSHVTIAETFSSNSFTWISAIVPIAFAYDGWIVATSISHEIKNPKKNLPIALIVAPITILLIYIIYFIGISIYVGPEKVIALGDAHVSYAAHKLLGNFGGKIILTFVTISVLGTLNGLILGSIRMPYSLAIRNMLPKSNKFNTINEKFGISVNSALLGIFASGFLIFVHYITQKYNMMPNSDVSEISVIFSYFTYIILYIQVIKLYKKGTIKSKLKGLFNPLLAIIGSLIILIGSLSNPLIIYYTLIFITLIISSLLFWKNQKKLQ